MVGADEHRRQGDDTDGEGRQPEADDRHRGATANERDERGDDGDRTERGAGGIGELRVLGNLQAVDPADAPQPRRSPGRHRTEVDENGQRGRQPAALHEGEQADSELGDSDGHEQPGERGVVGVEAGDAGVDRPGPDRGEAGELHDAHGNRHRPFVGGGRRRRQGIDDDLVVGHHCLVAHSLVLLSAPANSASLSESVGVRGFEPPASTSRTWRANQAALHPVAACHHIRPDRGYPAGAGSELASRLSV